MTLHCTDCDTPLGKRSHQKARAGKPISGQCAECWHFSRRKPPPLCRDCGATITRMSRGRRCHSCASILREQDLEFRGRRLAAQAEALKRPEVMAMKQRVARQNGAAHLQWMPRQYRDAYRHLRRTKGFNSKDAQKLIRGQMAVDGRGLDPFAAALIHAGLAA